MSTHELISRANNQKMFALMYVTMTAATGSCFPIRFDDRNAFDWLNPSDHLAISDVMLGRSHTDSEIREM